MPGPNSISGLVLWLEADALALSNNTPVATWTDQSSAANNATAAGTRRPTYKTSIINGLPVVRFDGSLNGMDLAASMPTSAATCIVVMQLGVIGSSQTSYAAFILDHAVRTMAKLTGTNWGTFTTGDVAAGEVLAANTPGILTTIAADTTTRLFRNGTFKAVTGALPGGGSVKSVGYESGLSRTLNGDIACILVYNSGLGRDDQTYIEGYLGTKYGITVSALGTNDNAAVIYDVAGMARTPTDTLDVSGPRLARADSYATLATSSGHGQVFPQPSN